MIRYKTISFDKVADYLIASVVILSLLLGGALVVLHILNAPFWKWNSSRLAWALSIFFGYEMYYGLGEGPLLARMYGPVSCLLYAPAILGRIPSFSIMIGSLISALLYFVPFFLLLIKKAREHKEQLVIFLYVFGCFCLFTSFFRPLRYVAFSVHVDAPAISFGSLACLSLYAYSLHKSRWHLFMIVSISSILSILSKQTMAPLVVAVSAYILVAYGRKVFVEYFLCFMIAVAISFSFVAIAFDLRTLFSEMLLIPSRQPFYIREAVIVGHFLNSFREQFLFMCAAILFFLFFYLRRLKERIDFDRTDLSRDQRTVFFVALSIMIPLLLFLEAGPGMTKNILSVSKTKLFIFLAMFYLSVLLLSWRASFSDRMKKIFYDHKWIIFLLSAVMIFFTSSVAFLKVGGDSNNIAPSAYFLILTLASIFMEVFINATGRMPSFSRSGVKIFCVMIMVIFIREALVSAPSLLLKAGSLKENMHDIAYYYAKSHPEEVYFPELSLSNLFADRKLYHSLDGISDRLMGRFLIHPNMLMAHVPANIDIIAFAPDYELNPFSSEVPLGFEQKKQDFYVKMRDHFKRWFFLSSDQASQEESSGALKIFANSKGRTKRFWGIYMDEVKHCCRFKYPTEIGWDYHKALSFDLKRYRECMKDGKAYLKDSQHKKALDFFREAYLINPTSLQALKGLGDVYADIGEYKKAEYFYHIYLQDSPHDLSSWKRLYAVLGKAGQTKKSLICLEEIIRLEPYCEQHWRHREFLYGKIGLHSSSANESLEAPATNAFFIVDGKGSNVFLYMMSFFPEFKAVTDPNLYRFKVFKRQKWNYGSTRKIL